VSGKKRFLREGGHSSGVTEPSPTAIYRQVIPTGFAAEVLVPNSIKASATDY
jgi:hypothetical protein